MPTEPNTTNVRRRALGMRIEKFSEVNDGFGNSRGRTTSACRNALRCQRRFGDQEENRFSDWGKSVAESQPRAKGGRKGSDSGTGRLGRTATAAGEYAA